MLAMTASSDVVPLLEGIVVDPLHLPHHFSFGLSG
jgi:hypothetical protein